MKIFVFLKNFLLKIYNLNYLNNLLGILNSCLIIFVGSWIFFNFSKTLSCGFKEPETVAGFKKKNTLPGQNQIPQWQHLQKQDIRMIDIAFGLNYVNVPW